MERREISNVCPSKALYKHMVLHFNFDFKYPNIYNRAWTILLYNFFILPFKKNIGSGIFTVYCDYDYIFWRVPILAQILTG